MRTLPSAPGIRHLSEATSGHVKATTWSATFAWQVRSPYGQFRCIRPVNQPFARPVDPTRPRSPNSLNPIRPTSARNAADVGRSRLCTGSRLSFLAGRATYESRKSLVPPGLRPGFDSLQSRFGDVLPSINSQKFSPLKCHPRRIKIISEMD